MSRLLAIAKAAQARVTCELVDIVVDIASPKVSKITETGRVKPFLPDAERATLACLSRAFDTCDDAGQKAARLDRAARERRYINSRLASMSHEEYGQVIAAARHAAECRAMSEGAFVAGRYYLDPAADVLYLLDKCAGLRAKFGAGWMETTEGAERTAELDALAVWWEARARPVNN